MFKKLELLVSQDARNYEVKKEELKDLRFKVANSNLLDEGPMEDYETALKEGVEIEKRVIKRRMIAAASSVAAIIVAVVGICISE